MDTFDHVSVVKKGNVYFDGKCVSHAVILEDGTKITLGVILPSTLKFTTGAPERMAITSGQCRVRLADTTEWTTYSTGEEFSIAANSYFDIEVIDTVDYVCYYG